MPRKGFFHAHYRHQGVRGREARGVCKLLPLQMDARQETWPQACRRLPHFEGVRNAEIASFR